MCLSPSRALPSMCAQFKAFLALSRAMCACASILPECLATLLATFAAFPATAAAAAAASDASWSEGLLPSAAMRAASARSETVHVRIAILVSHAGDELHY